jgi:hypothetical protein
VVVPPTKRSSDSKRHPDTSRRLLGSSKTEQSKLTINALRSLRTMTHNYAHAGNFTITDQFGDFPNQ